MNEFAISVGTSFTKEQWVISVLPFISKIEMTELKKHQLSSNLEVMFNHSFLLPRVGVYEHLIDCEIGLDFCTLIACLKHTWPNEVHVNVFETEDNGEEMAKILNRVKGIITPDYSLTGGFAIRKPVSMLLSEVNIEESSLIEFF